jgi:hypothetical protein
MGLLLGGAVLGCGRAPQEAQGTGAKECVHEFFGGILQRDFFRAYSVLDAASQKKCNPQQFSALATSYLNSFGFEAEKVHVRSCEEHGADATAHVTFTGHTTSQDRWHKDGIVLHREEAGWRLVLPANFGRTKFSGRPGGGAGT